MDTTLGNQVKWWLIFFIGLISISLILSQSIYDKVIKSEIEQVANAFGEGIAENIYDESLKIMNNCCGEEIRMIKEKRENDPEDFDTELTVVVESFLLSLHVTIIRILSLNLWLKWFSPFLIYLIVDAFVLRKIKAENLTWQSPIKYHLGMHGTVFAFGVFLLYLTFPHPLVIWVVPIVILSFAASLYVAISNFQRLV